MPSLRIITLGWRLAPYESGYEQELTARAAVQRHRGNSFAWLDIELNRLLASALEEYAE